MLRSIIYFYKLHSQSARRPQPGRGKDQMTRNPKIITSLSLKDNVELNQAQNAWTPSVKKQVRGRGGEEEEEEDDSEAAKTKELFRRVRSILNKLTPQMFQQLMKQVTDLTIDTEERLKGVIDLIFEKAISEPNFSVAYANMCRCLMGVSNFHLYVGLLVWAPVTTSILSHVSGPLIYSDGI